MRKYVFLLIISALVTVVLLTKSSVKVDAMEDEVLTNEFTEKINLKKAKNLMIVAHPDDETIWGGDHLLEEDYLVVCVTCGNNRVRDNEIRDVLKISDDELIKLGYPDNPGGIISDWSDVKDDIERDLDVIINMKNYDKIVTHNPDGEYGHIHHKMLNKIATRVVVKSDLADKLYYFAKYYKKEDYDQNLDVKYPVKNYNKKVYEMFGTYKSQAYIMNCHGHVMGSEKWQKYTDLSESESTKKY